MQTEKAWSWRVEHIPQGTTPEQLKLLFVEADQSRIVVESLVPDSIAPDLFIHAHASYYLTATISFRAQKGCKPQLIDGLEGNISLDAEFYGFTSLYSPEKDRIAADVVAVTGLAGHAFGSWTHSRTSLHKRMWLRDYLPEGIPNIRVLIYGYPSELQNSESSISLFEHSNNLKERLLAIRRAAQCELRPIIFIGHSLGGLVIKRVVVDANRKDELLPVRSFVFLGVPHRGLESTALKTLVQGTSSERMINELQEGSSVLEILDHDFEENFRRFPVPILTCYESSPTPTVKKSSDGSFKRDGDPVIMVTKARALLGYEDTKIGVYLDHSQIAKIDIGTTGPYLLIKQAIDRAILEPSRRSTSVAPLLGDDVKPKTGLTPELAGPSGRHKSPNNAEGDKDSVTATGPRSSLRRPSPVGEDLPINRAVYDSDLTNLRKLLKDAHLDKPDSQGYTPLMVAAATDQEKVVDDLIRRGASLEPSEPKGDTAFHLACRHAGVAVVSIFLKHADLLDIRGAEGRTPLMSSIQNPRDDIAKLILSSIENVEASDEHERTALHYAALEGKTEIVRLLMINRRASQNATTREHGWTPLHYAAQRKHAEVVELLGKNGTDCNTLTSKQDGARSAIHLVLLKQGLSSNGAECIRLLLRYGANIEQPDGAGRTPLHWAAQHGWPGRVKWLISNKAKLEATTDDRHERTPLHIAVEGGHLKTTRVLLDAGSNKDAAMKSPSGKTALHIATEGNGIDLVEELLARKVNIDPICDTGSLRSIRKTPLVIATDNEFTEIMRLLLQAGADVDSMRSTSCPLGLAVERGNLAAVKMLLDYKATTAPNGYVAPLTSATRAGNIPIMRELLAKGVEGDVEETDYKGYTCLFIAASLGQVDAVELLLDHGADPERKIEIENISSGKNERLKAGEYFRHDVSEQSRRRIRELLP